MKEEHRLFWGSFLLMMLLLLLAACGPATAPAQIPPPMAESVAEDNEVVDTAAPAVEQEDAPLAEKKVVVSSEEANDANGIPIGFTAEGRPYRGSLDAPVVMEEFSDYQCPYCSRFTEQTMPELLENQIASGDLLVVYYDFPLENIHPQALAAANAARCAGEQGAGTYWQMHDLLYANVSTWAKSNPDAAFSELASSLDLDQAQFDACVAEMRHAELIQQDIDHALSRGVRSTPTFFLNDQILVGAQPASAFNQAIASVAEGETIVEAEPVEESPLQAPAVKPEPVNVDMDNVAATLGDPDAPVTIVEFTDYQCPYCQRYASETLPTLISEQIEQGELYYVLKDLPLDGIHPNARAAAVAARCAGQQGAYWEMHDALFESQPSWGGSDGLPAEMFADLAATLGLDKEAFNACLDDDSIMQAIQASVEEAGQLGANSTPYFFVNGLPLYGAQPYELFDYAIGLAKEGTLADAYVPPEPDLENVYAVGDPEAPVTLIEYTDYQCPFCSRHFNETYLKIKENYVDTGQVYYVFKDFPLTNLHPQAILAAQAARCAGDQGEYLAMHDMLFQEQGSWSGNEEAAGQFAEFAGEIGLDTETFAACLADDTHLAEVLADLEEGSNRGINGTPAFIINGYTLSGAYPYATFADAIEQFLSPSG